MDRLGISQDMLDMAQEIGLTLQNSNEGLSAVQDSLATQQQLARRLERDSADRYQRANAALLAGDERMAKALLFERTGLQEKQKTVLIQCVEERRRLETMQNNIAQLERKAMEIDALLQRTVSAKLLSGSKSMDSDLGLSLRPEDPLLQKFRDLGMD